MGIYYFMNFAKKIAKFKNYKTLKVPLVDIVILKLYKKQGQRRLLNLIDHQP